MSAFKETGALLSIGGAILYTIGLNPQRISTASEARFPAHPIPGGLHYQVTGMGERTTTIEALTHPHVFGGLDSFARLRAIHETQRIVPYWRITSRLKGLASGACVIQTLEVDEEKLHPFDGIGRQVEVAIGLIMMPRSAFRAGRGAARRGVTLFGAPRR